MRARIVVIMCLLVLSSVRAFVCAAGTGAGGTRSAQFLKLGLGGRALAMGGAFVGLADDASAIYWNPAGLASLKKTELTFMHLAWLQDISYEYFAHAQPIRRWGVFGWSVAYLHMDKLEGRDEQGQATSDFSASDMAITLGFGRKVTDNLLLGLSVKNIDEKIENQNAYSLAFDLGCLYQTPVENLFLGGAVQSWGNGIKFVEESFGLPTIVKLGASYRHLLAGSPIGLAMDVCLPSEGETSLHWGTEYIYRKSIAGRIGYENGLDLGASSGLSFGLGFVTTRTQTYSIDYAFVPQGILGNSHAFSLSLRF